MTQPSPSTQRRRSDAYADAFAIAREAEMTLATTGDADRVDIGPTVLPVGTAAACPECGFRVGPLTRVCARCWFSGWWWP